MPAPGRAARVGGRRRFMPRKPLARRVAPLPQQTGYGRELREKELTNDGVGARRHRLRRCIFEGFSGQRDAAGMALTTAVAAGTAERSRRRRRGRSGKVRNARGAKRPTLAKKPDPVRDMLSLRTADTSAELTCRISILKGTQSRATQAPILDTVPARHPWHAAPTRKRLGHRESARRAA